MDDLPPRRVRPPERAWFFSDLHLDGGDPAGVERACAFVDHARAHGCDALFLLGDVFKAWLGRNSLRDAGLRPFLDRLGAAVADGVRVVLLHGNHDFLLGAHLEQALGVEVPGRTLDVVLGGQRCHLSHGDEYCVDDVDYQRLHRVLRFGPLKGALAGMPHAWQLGLARRLQGASTEATTHKTTAEMSIVDAEVERQLAAGADVAVCGHVHTARDAQLAHGRLLVLADFESTGCHAVFADGELRLRTVDPRWVLGRPVVVALDGPAGSGKSSVSRQLAKRLGFGHLDSGALYRAVTAEALREGVSADDGPALGALVARRPPALDVAGRVLLDGVPIPDAELRGEAVSAAVSQVSAHSQVRSELIEVQRAAATLGAGLVAEGRDMGTVVFPEADLIVYLDASLDVRAARRLAQNPGEGRDLAAVRAALETRDQRDSGRDVAPLKAAEKAEILETSELGQEAVVDLLEHRVRDEVRRLLAERRAAAGVPQEARGAGARRARTSTS